MTYKDDCIESDVTEIPEIGSWCYPGQFRVLARIQWGDFRSLMRNPGFNIKPVIQADISSSIGQLRGYAATASIVTGITDPEVYVTNQFVAAPSIIIDIGDISYNQRMEFKSDYVYPPAELHWYFNSGIQRDRTFAAAASITVSLAEMRINAINEFKSDYVYPPAELHWYFNSGLFQYNSFASSAAITSVISDDVLIDAQHHFASNAIIQIVINDPDTDTFRMFSCNAAIGFDLTSDGPNLLHDFYVAADIDFAISDPEFKRFYSFEVSPVITHNIISDANAQRIFTEHANLTTHLISDPGINVIVQLAVDINIVTSISSDAGQERQFAATANITFNTYSDMPDARRFYCPADITTAISSDIDIESADRDFASTANIVSDISDPIIGGASIFSGFDSKVKITIPASLVDEDLTDFPLRINVDDESGINSADLSQMILDLEMSSGDLTNQYKIAVTKEDEETQQYVEIENVVNEVTEEWLGSWGYRKKIKLSGAYIGANLSDVPVPIIINSDAGRRGEDLSVVFAELGDSSLKIAITKADGVTELPVDVSMWDASNNRAQLFTKIDVVADTDCYLWLYYDSAHNDNPNVGVTGSAIAQTVWSVAAFDRIFNFNGDQTNIINNGFFDDGELGWSYGVSGTTHSVVGGQQLFDRNSQAWGAHCYQDIPTIIGETYAWSVQFYALSHDARVWLDDLEIGIITSPGAIDGTFVAVDTTTRFSVRAASSGEATMTFDNVVVTVAFKDASANEDVARAHGYLLDESAVDAFGGKGFEPRWGDREVLMETVWASGTQYTVMWIGKLPEIDVSSGGEHVLSANLVTTNTDSGRIYAYSDWIQLHTQGGNSALEHGLGANAPGWHIFALVVNGTALSLYVDGELTDTATHADSHSRSFYNMWGKDFTSTFVYARVFASMWCIGDARSAEWIKLVSKASRDELAMWGEEEIAASWLGDWANRIEFTLDPDLIDEDLTDFPVALKVSDLSGISSVDMTDLFDKLAYPVTGDEFTGDDDDPPNPDLWTIIEGTPSINNNMLEDQVAGSTSNISSTFELVGDFDIEVDFEMLVGPHTNLWELKFIVSPETGTPADLQNIIQLARRWSNVDDIQTNRKLAGSWGTLVSALFAEDTGSMRLVRVDDTIQTYYDKGAGWVAHGPAWDITGFGTNLKVNMAWRSAISNPTMSATFNNFLINSGSISWPQATHPNRKKIAVTDEDGLTQLPVEIDSFDIITEQAVLHAKVSSILAAKNKKLYLYYDPLAENNEQIGDIGEAAAQLVWDSGFEAVYHMAQNPAIEDLLDSTEHGLDMTFYGGMDASDIVDGVVGKALNFNGSTQYAKSASQPFSGFPVTLEAVAKLDSLVTGIISCVSNSLDEVDYMGNAIKDDVGATGFIGHGGGTYQEWSEDVIPSIETWYMISNKFIAGNDKKVYRDGVERGSNTYANTYPNMNVLGIGCLVRLNNATWFDGSIGEVRFSSVVRSDAWIKATYHTLFDALFTVSRFTKPVSSIPFLEDDGIPWKYRVPIVIDSSKIDANLTDFPLTVQVNDLSGLNSEDLTDFFDKLAPFTKYVPNAIFPNVPDDIFGDSFVGDDDDPYDPLMWEDSDTSTVDPPTILDDKLHCELSGSDSQFTRGMFKVRGDFEIECNIANVTAGNSTSLRLMAINEKTGSTQGCYMDFGRSAAAAKEFGCRFNTGSWGTIFVTSRTDEWGRLKIVRSGSTFYAWYRDGAGDYTLLNSASVGTDDIYVYLNCLSIGNSITGDYGEFWVIGDVIWPHSTHPNRKRIAITDEDGLIQLPVEIDWFDIVEESAVLHTKIPSVLAAIDKKIYLYYDSDKDENPNVGDIGEAIAQSVWDDDFEGVWHLSQDPSISDLLDSTINGLDMTPVGLDSDDFLTLKPGKGLYFDNTTRIYVDISGILTDVPVTIETAGAASISAASNNNPSISFANSGVGDQQISMAMYGPVGRLNFYTGATNVLDGTEPVSSLQFTHLAATLISATDRNLFTNGGDKQTDVDSDVWPSGVNRIALGATADSTIGYRDGRVSEARVSSIIRSDAWIKATYHTLDDSLIYAQSREESFHEEYQEAPLGFVLHTKIPLVSSTIDTIIWLWWDSTLTVADNTTYVGVVGEGPAQLVWNDDFVLVTHLNNFIDESTSYSPTFAGDSFTGDDGDPPNPALWTIIEGAPYINNNTLKNEVIATSNISSIFELVGDFDIEVDFEILVGPHVNLWELKFIVSPETGAPADLQNIIQLARRYIAGYNDDIATIRKLAGSWSSLVSASFTEDIGSMRLVRVDDTIQVYYDKGAGWVALGAAWDITGFGTNLKVNMAWRSAGSTPFMQAIFDNFIINSGTIGWPADIQGIAVHLEDGDIVAGLKNGKAIDFDGTIERINWGSSARVDDIPLLTIETLFKSAGSWSIDEFTGDEFTGVDGDALNEKIWLEQRDDGNNVSIQSNKLNFTSPGGNVNEISQFDSKFILSGDFDIQVDFDFSVLTTPADSISWAANIAVYLTADDSYAGNIAMGRNDGGSYIYGSDGIDVSFAYYSTGHTSGKMKITRASGVIKIYIWSGTQWEWNGDTAGRTVTNSEAGDVYIKLWFEQENNSTVNSNLDNFVINSGEVIWPPYRTLINKAISDSGWSFMLDGSNSLFFQRDSSGGLGKWNDGINALKDVWHHGAVTHELLLLTGDDFTGDDNDPANQDLWKEYSVSGVNDSEILNNKLRCAIDAGVNPSGVKSHFEFPGDFDIQIDWDEIVGPNSNGWDSIFRVVPQVTPNSYFHIFRAYNTTYQNHFGGNKKTNGAFGTVTRIGTSLTTSKFKIVRVGTNIKCYFWSGSDWTLVRNDTWLDESCVLQFFQQTSGVNPDTTADFDNFVINSGSVIWPDGMPSNPNFHLDGVSGSVEIETPSGTWDSDAAATLNIGNTGDEDIGFDGLIGEIRISKVIRSAAWLDLTYKTLIDDLIIYSKIDFDSQADITSDISSDGDTGVGFAFFNAAGGDDFTGDGGIAPFDVAWEIADDTNNLLSIYNDRLEHNIQQDYDGANTPYLNSKFCMAGDFDVQLDFEIIEFTLGTATIYCPLFRCFALWDEVSLGQVGRRRYGSANDYTAGGIDITQTNTGSGGVAIGKFRITRISGEMRIYYWNVDQWEWDGNTAGLVTADNDTREVYFKVYFEQETTGRARAAIDNFVINSGTAITIEHKFTSQADIGFGMSSWGSAGGSGFFADFDVVDEDSDITKLDEKVSWDTMRRDAVSYVYGDFGVGYFKNFLVNFEMKIDDIMSNASGDIIAISNTIGTQQDMMDDQDGISMWAYGSGTGVNLKFRLKKHGGALSAVDYQPGGSSSDIIYCTFIKTGKIAVMKFFSDSEKTSLLYQLVYGDCEAESAYRYMGITNRDSVTAPTDTWTGYTQHWEIIESGGYDGGSPYEELDFYTMVNSEGKLTAYNTTIVWSDLDQNDAFYCYKDFGVDYFGDFDIEWESEMFKQIETTSQVTLIALGNDLGTWEMFASQNVGIIIDVWWASNVTNVRLRDFNGDVQDIDTTAIGDVNKWGPLYFKLERTGTAVTCLVYDDPERTNEIISLSITGASTPYRHLHVVNSRDTGVADACWGHSRDFDIILPAAPEFAEISYVPASDYPAATDGNVSMLQMPFDTYITVPNHSSLNPTEITLEWRGVIDGNASGAQVVIEKPYSSHDAPYYQYLLAYRTDQNTVRMDLAIGGTRYVILSLSQMEVIIGQRIIISGTYDGSDARLYLNGRLVAEEPISGTINGYSEQLWFGKHQNVATEKSDATFDEVRIWSVARTQAEIVLNMERQLTGDESGLEGLWLFNEDTGVSISDSANSNDGTVTGSYTWDSTTFTWDGVNDEKWHMPARLNLPTYDGDGNTVQPSIVYIPAGLSGYKWWMGMTPYPGIGEAPYENPSILASNDGIEWEVPGGVTNPLVPGDSGVIFNSDSNLIAISNHGTTKLFYYYRQTTIGPGLTDIFLIESLDGINWEDPIIVIPNTDIVETTTSPAVYYNGSNFVMIAIEYNTAILRWTSPNGVDWTQVADASISGLPGGRDPWHLDILYDGIADRLHFFLTTTTAPGGVESRAHYAYSDDDGLNITIVNYLTADLTAIEELQYQGSIVLDPDFKDRYWIFGSTYGGGSGQWFTTLITRRLSSGDLYQENASNDPPKWREDLMLYTEVDEDSDIIITNTRAAFDTMRQDANSYVYKDFGVDYFGDFEVKFEAEITQSNTVVPQVVLCAFSNTIGSKQTMVDATDGLIVSIDYNSSAGNITTAIKCLGENDWDTFVEGGSTTPLRYYTFKRSGTVLTLDIYSDPNRLILVDAMSCTCEIENKRYFTALAGQGVGSGAAMSGYTQNFLIN